MSSIASATIVLAALLGADPQISIISPPAPSIAIPTAAPVVAIGCRPAQNFGCRDLSDSRCRRPSGCCCLLWNIGCCLGDQDNDCDDDLCCWDRHLLNYCVGPGDLYPHFPYGPVDHGYYYFRPYHHEHVFQDAELAARMGGDPQAPYSVEFLKAHFPPAPIEAPQPPPTEEPLPRLEDLLSRRGGVVYE